MLLKRFNFLLHPSGDIDIARGIRTLLAVALPIAIGRIIHWSELGLMVGLVAELLFLVDIGGLYAIRAKTLMGTAIAMALTLMVGTWVSACLVLTILVVFCGLFLAGYLTVYGENGAAAGLIIALALLFAITLPAGGVELGIERALVVLVGGGWAIFVALCLWPFRPNQPLRQVVAKNFQGIAQYLRSLPSSQEEFAFSQILERLWQSRQILTYTRKGGWGRSDLRELLIVLIEDSDRLITTLMAVRELINFHPSPQLKTVGILLEDVLLQVAAITEDIAQLILGRNKIPDTNRLQLLIAAIEQQRELQQRALESDVEDYTSYAAVSNLKTWLHKLHLQLQLAVQTAQQLHQRERLRFPQRLAGSLWDEESRSWWEPMQENLSWESPLFRHALRLGLGGAMAVLIYTFFRIPHGFWIGLTLVIVLKPDFSITFQRFCYRIIGTILGAGAVTLLLATIHSPLWLEGIGVLSIAIALSLVRFHYSLAVFFITLFALILSQLSPDTPDVNTVGARLFCTVIGATIAFALSFGILRPQEELLFSSTVAVVIEQVNLYFQGVTAVYLGKSPYNPSHLGKIRHQLRLASTTLQTALQRLLNDPSTPFSTMEPAITLANYVPRLSRGVTVLLFQLEHYSGSNPHPQFALFTQQVTQTLTQLAQSLRDNTPPLPLPNMESTLAEILSHIHELREERLAEIANRQDGTSTHQYLRDYNVVASDLVEIVRRLEAIHTAICRFEMAANN